MARQKLSTFWSRLISRNLTTLTRNTLRAAGRATVRAAKAAKANKPAARALRGAVKAKVKPQVKAVKSKAAKPTLATTPGWTTGISTGPGGARRYALYRPPGLATGERLPMLVMLHGCRQDAAGFALATRMNALAARQRFWVLYPEQDRSANAQGCWNWFDTRNGRAAAEAASILNAIDTVCRQRQVDGSRIALAGLSAGASIAGLLARTHPQRFKAVVMHSGIAPGSANSALSALRAMRGRRVMSILPPPATAVPPGPAAARWPPLLVIHGSLDGVVAPSNAQAAVLAWAAAAGAQPGPARKLQRGTRYATTVTDYKTGRRSVATLVMVSQLGHAWSGGASGQPYADAKGPDASRMAWAFALKQFRAAGH